MFWCYKCYKCSSCYSSCYLFTIIICENNLYFKKIVSFPMCVLQYMFAADMFPVFCLNMTLQGKGGGCKYKTLAQTSSWQPFRPAWLRPSGAQAVWPTQRCVRWWEIQKSSPGNPQKTQRNPKKITKKSQIFHREIPKNHQEIQNISQRNPKKSPRNPKNPEFFSNFFTRTDRIAYSSSWIQVKKRNLRVTIFCWPWSIIT